MFGIVLREGEVHEARVTELFDRVSYAAYLEQKALREIGEVLTAQFAEQRFLVGEVTVQRRSRVLDSAGDLAHGHCFVAALGEELARGVENLQSQLLPFSLASLFDAHARPVCLFIVPNRNSGTILNRVKYWNVVPGEYKKSQELRVFIRHRCRENPS